MLFVGNLEGLLRSSSFFFDPSRLRGSAFVSEFGFRHSDLIRVSGIRISVQPA
jgi:hypothetical protein